MSRSMKEKLVELACLRWQLQEGKPWPQATSRGASDPRLARGRASSKGEPPSGAGSHRREDLLG